MKEYISTIGSKGQVTIPVEVLEALGVDVPGRIALEVTDSGVVELRPVRLTLEDVLGSIEALPGESTDLDREIREATEEALSRNMRRLNRQ